MCLTQQGQASARRYVYDLAGNVLAETDGSNAILRYYIHGLGLLAMVDGSGNVYTYHFDGTANTVAITNATQTVVQSYAYLPYGKIANESGALDQPFTFVGQFGVMREPNGFYYMRARYYDPEAGRFISEDPIGFGGGQVNLYAYVRNNPLGIVDPFGTEAIPSDPTSSMLVIDSFWLAGLTIAALAEPTPFGEGALITGFTKHGINQVISRGIAPAILLDALRNPTAIIQRIDEFGRVSYQYVGQVATVVVNAAKQVITAWPN